MAGSKEPIEVVRSLLSNPTDSSLVESLVSPSATYVSLCYSNPALKKIMPYAGAHDKEGPGAITYTFSTVAQIWSNEAFEIQSIFGSGEDIAVFGKFTYKSRSLGKSYTSPFSIWCKVGSDGLISYMQFMEDTFGTGATFEVEGEKKYRVPDVDGENREFTL